MRGWVSKTIAKKPSGVTSLLLVLAIGVVLTIMVGGIAALTVREQQQASNTEFSKRALQTAEAGIETAIQKLSKDPGYSKIGCNVADDPVFKNVVTDPNQQITCAEVKSIASNYEGNLDRDRTTTFFFNTNDCDSTNNCVNILPDSLQLRWSHNVLDAAPGSISCTQECAYPKYEGYKYPASMELNFIYWPVGQPQTMKVATAFIVPGQKDEGYSKTIGNQIVAKCSDQQGANPNLLGEYRCVTTNSQNSEQGFSLSGSMGIPANYVVALRLTPRYTTAHYQLRAFKNNQEIFFKSSKAMIDITAKVGNLYRRVKAEKVTGPTSVEGLFDSVVYSGKGLDDQGSKNICKNQIVLSDGSPAPGSPPCI